MTFDEYKGLVTTFCIANNVQSRFVEDLLYILFLTGISPNGVVKYMRDMDALMGLDKSEKIPYDPKCTLPLGASVIKAVYVPGDAMPKGSKGVVRGGVVIEGYEVVFVHFDGMPEDMINGVKRNSLKEIK